MNKTVSHGVNKAVDSIQQRLTDYALDLKFESLSPEAVRAAKMRVIDTLGALIGGFFGDSSRVVRNLAAQMPNAHGATILGTRMKTTPEMAAFVNAITSCHADWTDAYHWPGSSHGHPSNLLTPVLAAAEYVQASGRDFITSVVLAYEIYIRFADVCHNQGFDTGNFACIGTAVAAGKLLKLSGEQLAHCISMAVVPNVMLKQGRTGQLSMFYTVPAGQAGRAGVFAAMLAQAGMEGPHLPYEGKAGWCDHVALKRFSFDTLGGKGVPFKIMDALIKTRPSTGITMPPILAAEKIAPLQNLKDVKQITVEVYKSAKDREGKYGMNGWIPDSRITAYYSIPYGVAAALMDGTVTLRSYNEAHLWHPELRALLPKIKVVENEEFTKVFERVPVEHRTRVTVVMNSGERLVGESGGDPSETSAQTWAKSDAQVTQKFRALTEGTLGAKQVDRILDRLWHLEDIDNVAEIPAAFAIV